MAPETSSIWGLKPNVLGTIISIIPFIIAVISVIAYEDEVGGLIINGAICFLGLISVWVPVRCLTGFMGGFSILAGIGNLCLAYAFNKTKIIKTGFIVLHTLAGLWYFVATYLWCKITSVLKEIPQNVVIVQQQGAGHGYYPPQQPQGYPPQQQQQMV